MMETRQYKNTGKKISLLGLGCMRFPKISPDKEAIDYEKAQEIVDYAYTHGVNYFDTAYVYHGGDSEVFIGKALKKYPRESYNLATKMPVWLAKNQEDLERLFQEQLDRCGVDYFDFYLCHATVSYTHLIETIRSLAYGAIPSAEKGVALGVATLDASGNLKQMVLPNIISMKCNIWIS